jgi:hypothetical protein
MRSPCLLLSLFLLLFTNLNATDVYIVAGQSNGWRLSHLSQGTEPSVPAVHYFGMNCVSEPDSAPLKTLTALNPATMGFGLAHALRTTAGKEIIFIQYCRCGAPVTAQAPNSWFPGEDPASGRVFEGGLLPRFEKYIRSAREQVEQAGHTWEVKGLIWHQGESDASSDKAIFERDLRRVFDRFRSLLGAELPIVAGHIRDLGESQRAVNGVLDHLAAEDPLLATVPLEGITFEPDDKNGKPNVHIDATGCRKLGAAMARALEGLRLASAVVAAGGKIGNGPEGPLWIDMYNGNNPLKGKGGRNESVTDQWLAQLSGCKTLRKLNLSNCAITNAGLAHLQSLTALEEINLGLTDISDAGLIHLQKLARLRTLILASTQCTGSGFAHLHELQHLENVNFHFTPLDDAGLREISNLGISGRFWFAHTRFSDAGAASLSKMKNLRICGMGSKTTGSSGESVAALRTLPHLEDLALLDNQADAIGIGYACEIRTLRRLDLSYAPGADDECLKKIALLPALEELSIGGSSKITPDGLLVLATAPALKKVILGKSKNIGSEAVEALKMRKPSLEVVSK